MYLLKKLALFPIMSFEKGSTLFTPMKLSRLIVCQLLLAVDENFAAFTALVYADTSSYR